jgi:hypothetical protein
MLGPEAVVGIAFSGAFAGLACVASSMSAVDHQGRLFSGIQRHQYMEWGDGGGGTEHEYLPSSSFANQEQVLLAHENAYCLHIARSISGSSLKHHFIFFPTLGFVVEYTGTATPNAGGSSSGKFAGVRAGSWEKTMLGYDHCWVIGSTCDIERASLILCRAMLNLGRNNYTVDFENCEHFATFAMSGKPECAQAHPVVSVVSTLAGLFRKFCSVIKTFSNPQRVLSG